MVKPFIFSDVVGQRDQRFQHYCHSPGLEHHQDHGITLNRVNSPLYLPEIRFLSVIQPQEAGIAITLRNIISYIIHKVALWGNYPFSGSCAVCLHMCLLGCYTEMCLFIRKEQGNWYKQRGGGVYSELWSFIHCKFGVFFLPTLDINVEILLLKTCLCFLQSVCHSGNLHCVSAQ